MLYYYNDLIEKLLSGQKPPVTPESVIPQLAVIDAVRDHCVELQLSRVRGEEVDEKLWGKAERKVERWPESWQDERVRIYQMHTEEGFWGSVSGSGSQPSAYMSYCDKLYNTMVVAWDGSIGRCCYVYDVMRNIIPIGELWEGGRMNCDAARQQYLGGSFVYEFPKKECSQGTDQ